MFSKIARRILEKRYYLKDSKGNLIEKTPEELFMRIAKAISRAEDKYKTGSKRRYNLLFYKAMIDQKLMPASPVLFNAGTEREMLASCFALPVEDNLDSILKGLSDGARIFKAGGGVGWQFSKLRAKNAVLATGGTSSGPCSFITLYDCMIETIKQGGKRKGAGAALLDASHPDIEEFITTKKNTKNWRNLNLSVLCSDKFMQSVKANEPRAKYIWDLIIDSNWSIGDPNMLFIDTANRKNSLPKYPIDNSNPCLHGDTEIETIYGPRKIKDMVGQEIPVLTRLDNGTFLFKKMFNIRKTGESTLLKITFDNGKHVLVTPTHNFYTKKLKKIQAKDLIIDIKLNGFIKSSGFKTNKYLKVTKIKQIDKTYPIYNGEVEDTHKYYLSTGVLTANCSEVLMSSYESCNLLGVNLDKCIIGPKDNHQLDWDELDCLITLGHRFLDNMIDICRYPLQEIDDFAKKTRRQGLYFFGLAPILIKLGLRYGSDDSLKFINKLFDFINKKSLEACSKLGEERGNFPDFKDSTYAAEYNHMRCSHRLTLAPSGSTSRIADSYFSIEPYYAFETESHILDEVITEKYSIKEEYEAIYPDAIITAHDISPQEHIETMAIITKYIDQSISKTVNVSETTTKQEVSNLFMSAYDKGLKCLSIFRDNCREDQVLYVKTTTRQEPIECRSGACNT